MTPQRADYDSPWKDILEAYFEDCIQFFFPDVYPQVDWSRGYEFLDKELQQVVREAEVGTRFADKLVKVWTLAGDDIWVLIHIEVQSQARGSFAERMFTYYYRLRDRFNRPVVSFAILSDGNSKWRPESFTEEMWGCRNYFEFRTVKLLDYQQQWSQLTESKNPFAVVVMAHLKTLETASLPEQRRRWKLELAKGLSEQGRDRQDVINLMRFIDWILVLPQELDQLYWQDLDAYQKDKNMAPYRMRIEIEAAETGMKRGLEQGLEQGRRLGLLDAVAFGLELKFGEAGLQLAPDIQSIESISVLQAMLDSLKTGASVDELRRLYIDS